VNVYVHSQCVVQEDGTVSKTVATYQISYTIIVIWVILQVWSNPYTSPTISLSPTV
jgi:hypothetical protein